MTFGVVNFDYLTERFHRKVDDWLEIMKILKITLFHFVWINLVVFVPHYLGMLVRYIDEEIIDPSTYPNPMLPNWVIGAFALSILGGIAACGEWLRRTK